MDRAGASSKMKDLLDPLTRHVNKDDLQVLAKKFSETYRDLAQTSTQHFLATPLTDLPTGLEKGKFLAIDVGGTNLRVGIIELLGDSLPKIRHFEDKLWPIGDHMKMDKAEDLFAWIGDCIAEVVSAAIDKFGSEIFSDTIPLGITFSFPMRQSSMSEAILMPMGKGFAITSDLNLGRMLLAGYSRHCDNAEANGKWHVHHPSPERWTNSDPGRRKLPPLRIAAITNDAVATFAASAYLVKAVPLSRTSIGLIVGTGCNATAPMKLKMLHPSKRESIVLPSDANLENTTVVVNTEWTIRGTDVPMKEVGFPTIWDEMLDKNSEYPGFQPFEYMTAGRYLGEIVRLALVDLVAQDPGVSPPEALLRKNTITTAFLATTVTSADNATLRTKLTEMFPTTERSSFSWDSSNIELLRRIAEAVQIRSSALIAAAIVGLLACTGEIQLDGSRAQGQSDAGLVQEELVVAYTGSTIAGYPNFLSNCQGWIDKLVANGSSNNASRRVVLKETLNGGTIGAAVCAGMAASKL